VYFFVVVVSLVAVQCTIWKGLPGISYPNLFVSKHFVPQASLTLTLTLTIILKIIQPSFLRRRIVGGSDAFYL